MDGASCSEAKAEHEAMEAKLQETRVRLQTLDSVVVFIHHKRHEFL
jgi:hypothetical protein